MRHLVPMLIKFVLDVAVLAVVLPWVAASAGWGPVLALAIALVAVSYPLGDLGLLPRKGQWLAVPGDWLLAALVLWAAQWVLPGFAITFPAALVVGAVLAVGEFFIHLYIQERLRQRRAPTPGGKHP